MKSNRTTFNNEHQLKKKDKGRTPQSIATEVDYLKKRQKVAPYGAKYTG